VERFALAKSVAQNRPVGDLEDIRFDDKGVAAVYAFSDVVGMKDDFIFYHWMRDGREIAKVRIGVWADRWRSYSSKVINRSMKGRWRVELRNAKGRVLASAEFDY
jgi:hypothetical protein